MNNLKIKDNFLKTGINEDNRSSSLSLKYIRSSLHRFSIDRRSLSL